MKHLTRIISVATLVLFSACRTPGGSQSDVESASHRQAIGASCGGHAAPNCVARSHCDRPGPGDMSGICMADDHFHTKVRNVTVTASNGGINPSMRGYTVRGEILSEGSNSCVARDYKESFITVKASGRVLVMPVSTKFRISESFCPANAQPVWRWVETNVISSGENLVLVDVQGHDGEELSFDSLMSSGTPGCVDSSLAGMCAPNHYNSTNGCPAGQSRCVECLPITTILCAQGTQPRHIDGCPAGKGGCERIR